MQRALGQPQGDVVRGSGVAETRHRTAHPRLCRRSSVGGRLGKKSSASPRAPGGCPRPKTASPERTGRAGARQEMPCTLAEGSRHFAGSVGKCSTGVSTRRPLGPCTESTQTPARAARHGASGRDALRTRAAHVEARGVEDEARRGVLVGAVVLIVVVRCRHHRLHAAGTQRSRTALHMGTGLDRARTVVCCLCRRYSRFTAQGVAPTIPVSRPSFPQVLPGMRSIHPHKCHCGREISVDSKQANFAAVG